MSTHGLRVLMLGYYPVEGMVFGGSQAAVGALAPALAAADAVAHVTVLSFHRGKGRTRTERHGDKLEVRYARGQRRLGLLTRSFLEVAHARRVIAELQPDVVHGHGMGWSGDIATQISRDAVITVHGMIHVEARMASRGTLRDRARIALIDHMVRQVLKRASVVISISPYASQMLDGMIAGDLVHIPNTIAAEFFSATALDSARKNLLFAGVMRPRKNVVGIINAFASVHRQHPDARLVIVGPTQDSAYDRQARDRVATLGLADAVQFVGFVENDRLIEELRGCRSLVMFSQEETLPTIIAQAQAMGRPVIASRVGGIAEMLAHGESGFLVDASDETALAAHMTRLCDEPELARAMGAVGRRVAAERYSQPAIAHQTIAAYQLVLRKRALSGGRYGPT